MRIPQIFAAGMAGEQLSRKLTGTNEVCPSRSVVAAGAGTLLGAALSGTLVVGTTAVGATALATVAAPLVVPIAVASGVMSVVSSWFD